MMHSFFLIQMYQTVLNSLRSERWLQQMCKAELRPKQVSYSSVTSSLPLKLIGAILHNFGFISPESCHLAPTSFKGVHG